MSKLGVWMYDHSKSLYWTLFLPKDCPYELLNKIMMKDIYFKKVIRIINEMLNYIVSYFNKKLKIMSIYPVKYILLLNLTLLLLL